MRKLYLKALLFLCVIGGFIFIMDRVGIFKPDQSNFHEKRRWDSFYEFTKSNDVDVLLIGNSHLYTGINPNHLSCVLGANCFILAAPGTAIPDSYFTLKEGLTRCDPKVVVVETYGIKSSDIRKYTGGGLTLEFRSFYSRKNLIQKLLSTPFLFSPDNYLMAWSESVRGHDILFKDPKLVKKNLSGKNTYPKRRGMDLGRFTTYTKGITEESDRQYDEKGPVVDGDSFRVNRESYDYVKKIEALCDKKGIKLVFLTLPMYYKHVKNYSSWHTIVSRVIGNGYHHLDLQDPYDMELFTRDCFQNTRNVNQHMTAHGAFVADYKLADFLLDKAKVDLPDRSKSRDWRMMFYGEKGYFEHYTQEPGDTSSFMLCKDVDLGGVKVMDSVFIPGEDSGWIYMRLDKKSDLSRISGGMDMYLMVTLSDGSKERYKTHLSMDPGISPRGHYLLSTPYSGISGINSVQLETIVLLSNKDQ